MVKGTKKQRPKKLGPKKLGPKKLGPKKLGTRKLGTRKNTLFKSDSVVFFDDDLDRNINPFRDRFPKIKSILIPPSWKKSYTQILKGKSDFYYPMMYSKKYKNNRYAQEIVKDMDMDNSSHLCDQCNNVTNQGITISQTKKIIKWANEPSTKERAVLFDLDNTLSACNLIMRYQYIEKLEEHAELFEEIAQYISGTIERYDALQLMFFYLRKNGVACKIFTNNGWAKRENDINFQVFLKIMQAFDPKMKEDDIIFGKNNKEQTFKENKDMMKIYKQI